MLFSIFLFLGSSRVDLNDSQLKIVLVYFIYPPVHMPSETQAILAPVHGRPLRNPFMSIQHCNNMCAFITENKAFSHKILVEILHPIFGPSFKLVANLLTDKSSIVRQTD